MIMMKPKLAIVVQSFIIIMVLICLATCDSASWLQQEKLSFIFEIGDEIDINCNLTDPTINVTLWMASKIDDDNVNYRQVVPNGIRIQQFNQMFRLRNVGELDGGQYQCRSANMTPCNVLEVHLSHDGEPRPIPKISVKSEVAYGKDVTLQCSASGSSLELTWYKRKQNGTKNDWQLMKSVKQRTSFNIYTGKRESKQTLVIRKFNVSDNGVYICHLRRNYVKWTKCEEKYVGIRDLQKPNFTKFPKPLITRNENSWIQEHYQVEGPPNPSITWYKINGRKEERLFACYVDAAGDYQCSKEPGISNPDISRNEFFMSPLSFPNDNATFKCVASNSLGITTKIFRLNVLAKPKIAKSKEREVSLVHVYKGSPEPELVCKVQSANPNQIRYSWAVQLAVCTNADCRPNNSNWRLITGTEVGLQISTSKNKSTLTSKKGDQHFFYRCTAKNDIGEDSRVWKVVPVKGPQPLKAVQSSVEVDEDENVKLSCQVARFTSTLVRWSYNDKVVQLGSRMEVVNSSTNGTVYNTLHIRKVNVTDSGKYKCFGEFNGIVVADDVQLKVRGLKAPEVSLKNFTKKQTSSFDIRCNVNGYPEPEITWKRNGELLEVVDSVNGTHGCGSRKPGFYKLSNVEKKYATIVVICDADYKRHSGRFSCTARNKLGNGTATALINILAPPTITKFKSDQQIIIGEKFLLKCEASGNPTPQVWWEKKDKDTSTFTRMENEHSDELRFDQLEESDLGDYRCFAQNKYKISTENYTIALSIVSASKAGAPPNMSNKYPIVIGCVSFFIVVIVIIVAAILYKRKKAYGGFYILTLPPLPDYIKKLDPHTPLTEQTNKLPYDAEWEFPRNRLKFSRELGSGAFGKVYLADALGIVAFDPRGSTKRRSSRRRFGGSIRRNHYVNNNKMTKVAVKTLKEDSGETEYKDLLSELKILIHVGEHKNIVNLLGACTKGRESELWVIIEFCSNGNLLQFLRNRRDIYETEWKGVSKDPNVQLTMTDLVIVAYQVARGMEFLASRLCIHRDLATRNILVTDNYVIKIADFGLARDVGQDSQYVKTSTGLLPVKWMAIEAIIQRLFTEKSDVWSFGIVLWELFTLGGTPYPNISPNEVAEFLARGHRMEAPHACPDEISTLMMKCWQEDKDCRPTFKELVEILDKIIELHTSSEGGCGYLEVQGEVMNEYLSPSDVKTPEMDPFECNSPLPPIPSPGDNENDSLLFKDQNARRGKFRFDKAIGNKGRKDSEIEKMQNDHIPEIIKAPDVKFRGHELDGYIDTSLTGKEKERIERDLDKDRDSSEEPQTLGDYAYWKKSIV